MAKIVTLKNPDGETIYPVTKASAVDGINVNYSTSEVDTGTTWIDGSHIYRKVLTGTAANSINEMVAHGITNFDCLINVHGYLKTTFGQIQPIARVCADGNVSIYSIGVGDFSSTEFLFQHTANNYFGASYAIVLEYTKSA